MKRVAILLLALNLFGAMILNLSVQESKNRVDLILNFDIPFDGKIIQKREKEKIILYLPDVKILAPWQKKLNTSFVYQIEVLPAKGGSNVLIYTAKKVKIFAARSKDGFSLKIGIKNPTPITTTTKTSFHITAYWKWIAIALATLVIFWFLLKLLFGRSKPAKTKTIHVQNPKTSEFEIKFEKPLDERNKIALISFKGIDYLVLIGTTNVLLGKYKEGEIGSLEEFESAIESQDISQAMRPAPQDEIFTTIEEYKRKASGEL